MHGLQVFDDKEAPDDGTSGSDTEADERGEEHYFHDKTENFIDYYREDGRGGGGGQRGGGQRHLVAKGPHIVTENREFTTPQRQSRRGQQGQPRAAAAAGAAGGTEAERKDALTRRPLNFVAEEKTRRKETDKWLERHFGGSEWSLFSG